MVSFPNITPEIFSISIFGLNLSITWYALSYILGFIIALFCMKTLIRKQRLWRFSEPPMELEQADSLLTYLILGVLVGGRVGYVTIYNPEYYFNNPIKIFALWEGGMSFHGGFFGVIIALALFCRFNGIVLASAADLIAVSSPPGIFFGRIANFINGELWGRPTMLPWGVVFPSPAAQTCGGLQELCARHPSQLYEAGLEGLLLFFLLLLLCYKGALRYPWLVTGIFLLGYGASRFFVEYFRVPDPQFISSANPFGFVLGNGYVGVTMGQLLSIPMIVTGLVIGIAIFVKVKAQG